MTAPLTCAELEALATELALGGLDGSSRAAALGHLAGCPACQSLVEDLSVLADRLLLLAPQDEPSPGFESRVIAGMDVRQAAAIERLSWRRLGRSRLGWRALAAAASVVLVVSATLVGVSAHRSGGRSTLTREYVVALQRLGGRSLRAAPLEDAQGHEIGQAFVYDGAPSWVFVSVDGGTDGEYSVVCTGPSAGPLAWSGLHVTDGHGALGFSVAGNVRPLERVGIVDKLGHAPYVATLDRSAA
jgi:hypothetical protein